MNKIICIGDLHGDNTWKQIVNQEQDADLFVFLGDYFDSFIYNTEQQCNNFLDIIAFKKANLNKVILLIGNHELQYIVGNNGTAGYQEIGKYQIEPILKDNLNLLQIVYNYDKYLFSHAGICPTFLNWTFGVTGWNKDNFISLLNDYFIYKPKVFEFNGYYNSYGNEIGQTPLWIRPQALIASNKKSEIKKNFVQIVGHTAQKQIDIKGKSTGGKYYFIDTINSNKEYLIIENNKISSKKVENV